MVNPRKLSLSYIVNKCLKAANHLRHHSTHSQDEPQDTALPHPISVKLPEVFYSEVQGSAFAIYMCDITSSIM